MYCESRDDESERVKTFSKNMLHIDNEYETPIESKYYQNNENLNNVEKTDNRQKRNKLEEVQT